ncbi:MAG: hypothetical protein U0573_09590 [Phycisphaerales bacterium]|nr:hypothetical protein [Planctomycetota bacterium]
MSGCVGASLVVLALAGCAANRGTVGQSFVPGALGAEIRNASPVSMSAATPIGEGQNAPDAREVTTSTGTGPAGYALANEHEARWWAQNQVQRNIYFKRLPDGALAFNSNTGTDVDIGADEFAIDPATGTIAGKGLRIRTNSSEPVRASNESLVALREVFQAMSHDQQAVFLAQLQAQKEAIPSLASEIARLIQFLSVP